MDRSEQGCRRDSADIATAMEAWEAAFSAPTPEAILALYAQESLLWGTLSPILRDTPAALRDYFKKAFTFTERAVSFHDSAIRIYGDTAVSTGAYTFSWVREGRPETIPARYSFTYVRREGRWLIVDHHSSALPEG